MTINPTQLTELFTRDFVDETIESTIGYQQNYQAGSIDLLLQRARKNKSVRENRIFDYIQVENDPNFSRNANNVRDKFEKYISALSISTSIVTVINAQLQLSGLSDLVPKNLQTLLFNFQTLADSNINMLSNIQQLVSFSQIERALFADLKFNFLGEVITFQEIALFADRALSVFPLQDSIKNTGIRPLLSLGVQNLLPESVLGVFQTVQWADTLNDIFSDESLKNQFDKEIQSKVETQSQVKVNTVVVEDRYDDINLTLTDPLGTATKQEFTSELTENYITQLEAVIEGVAVTYDLSYNDLQSINDIIIEDTRENISAGLDDNSLALPKLSSVTKAVNTETYNETVNAINTATEMLMTEIISDIGIKQPSAGERPLDYLQNLKANIRRRTELETRGGTSEEFERIDAYLQGVILTGQINNTVINDLNERVNNVLKET